MKLDAWYFQMIAAISGPLRSKRIHIGMDEAHGVSEGRYRQFFGYKDSTKVVRYLYQDLMALSSKTNTLLCRTVHRPPSARQKHLRGTRLSTDDLVRQHVLHPQHLSTAES